MAYIDQIKVVEIEKQITADPVFLGKLYQAKKNEYQVQTVDHNMVDTYLKDGWEVYGKSLKTKTRIRKLKSHSRKFEDDMWCQMYELGYRTLNISENLHLNFTNDDKKQIDVIAINEDTAIIIECKSSEKFKKASSLKDEFELLGMRLDGFKKTLHQIYGRNLRVKFIFATRNLKIDMDGEDMKRLLNTNSFYYNNNTYKYVDDLIRNYKHVAFYQFLGLLFKGELISRDKIEIPAVKGEMGTKTYYMFSVEPEILLRMGFILHRTKVNESEFPTYQRLLVAKRLPGITKFIDGGGYFPNSIIINFNSRKHKIQFEASSKSGDSNSCYGTLKIPNSYAIAYIIDGQHRVYGYANSKFRNSNTIPVVAFENLDTSDQLKIFMDINENQKAVSPSLRLDLEEDLYWNSDRTDSRIKALRSSIIKELANNQNSPLYERISVGEDKSLLSFQPFSNALSASNLLPKAKGNSFTDEAHKYSLYNISNHDHNAEMIICKKRIFSLLAKCYDFAEQSFNGLYNIEKSLILSNRGTYPFICVIDSLNKFLTDKNVVFKTTDEATRFEKLKPYLNSLLHYLQNEITEDEKDKQLSLLGGGVETKWLRFFQSIIHKKHEEYFPVELVKWLETQDEELQNKGRALGIEIEKRMKHLVLSKMKTIYGDVWDLEINSIKRECQSRAEQEMEKNYKDGLGKKDIDWTEMFNINDYKKIVENYWTKKPENHTDNFVTFEKDFSIDIGEGVGSKTKALKWISFFNSYRNVWAHEGTKEKRLNREEVEFIENVYNHFYN
ncbi:DGQHR domain-containing protein [Flavobacterium sp. HJ-32-4]|uniref:DGQHR domain-containing protein n=2 Tax=unclassified Flavobacterium TaxID=196869 RepID=UPI001F13BB22|nr:DGQHR domain-containing protein [Flavobacterium sp. HJ-32-4]UMY64513.1 DGQHR domain-containing protein [Flavobacterium sp. HJ-32-4]